MNFEDIESDARAINKLAWNPRKTIAQGGLLKYVHGGEYHAYNPDVVQTLQKAVTTGDYEDWKRHAELVNNRPPVALRDLLNIKPAGDPIDVDQVEPLEDILQRFDWRGRRGQVALRHRPHVEDQADRLRPLRRHSPLPGQCRGIADQDRPGRQARRGRPAAHHDIYSIEDLAQLIFDLKQVNPQALISVKLVAEAGVGTIAAGVAKAYADLITIAGYDGGTGASPLTSVKYAGSPWELGLTETHQVLRANNLRDKVRVQTDGGLKTGLDVVKAAMLGAESFGFGTGPMVAMGCKYLRICHLNNCATGVATQNSVLREMHFDGNVEKVKNYFRFIARDVREILAGLGVRRLADVIGRTDLLEMLEGDTAKQNRLDLSPLLSDGGLDKNLPQYCIEPHTTTT